MCAWSCFLHPSRVPVPWLSFCPVCASCQLNSHCYEDIPADQEARLWQCSGFELVASRDGGLHAVGGKSHPGDGGSAKVQDKPPAPGEAEAPKPQAGSADNDPKKPSAPPAATKPSGPETAKKKEATESLLAYFPAFHVMVRQASGRSGSDSDDDDDQDDGHPLAVLIVRGTATMTDVLIDSQALPVPLNFESNPQAKASAPAPSNHHYGHEGMAKAAAWVESEAGPILEELASSGCRVVLCGHSLGAGVVALLHARLNNGYCGDAATDERRAKLATVVECVGFGAPPCVDGPLARKMAARGGPGSMSCPDKGSLHANPWEGTVTTVRCLHIAVWHFLWLFRAA